MRACMACNSAQYGLIDVGGPVTMQRPENKEGTMVVESARNQAAVASEG